MCLTATTQHIMEQTQKTYVFDFDSTLTRVEALDVLAEITLANNPQKDKIIEEIIDITNKGIDGDISFTESLERRIKLLNASKSDLVLLTERLKDKVSKSIIENKEFFEDYANDIYVISCGFKEFIDPIVAAYNIPTERVFANTFVFCDEDKIVGFDAENSLAKHNGKIECLKNLDLPVFSLIPKQSSQYFSHQSSNFIFMTASLPPQARYLFH